MRKTLQILAILLAATVIAFIFLPAELFGRLLSSQLGNVLSARGIRASFVAPQYRVLSLSSSSMELFFPRTLTTVAVQDPLLSISGWSLLRLNPQARFSGKVLSGEIDFSGFMDGDNSQVTIELRNIKPAEHPVLAPIALTDGTLSLDAQDVVLSKDGAPLGGTFTLTGTNFEKSTDSLFAIPSARGPVLIAIPSFSNLNITATGSFSPGVVSIAHASSDSSLGKISGGQGTISLAQNTIDFSGSIELSQGTINKFGPLLNGFFGRAFSESNRHAKLRLSGNLQSPRVQLLDNTVQ